MGRKGAGPLPCAQLGVHPVSAPPKGARVLQRPPSWTGALHVMWSPLQGRTHPIQDAMRLLLKCVPLRVTSLDNVNSSLWYWVQAEAAPCPLCVTHPTECPSP